jgi:hypothetical protein
VTERYPAWQCVGCGRIDGPQPCVGICRDRKVELVDAAELDRAQARVAESEQRAQARVAESEQRAQARIAESEQRAQARITELERLLQVLAHTTPHADAWERSWLQLQARARELLRG